MAAEFPSGILLDDREDVLAFWRDDLGRVDTPHAIAFLTGGVSSNVIRVVTAQGAFVIKQALPQLRVAETWLSRPERSRIEVRCARVLAELAPGAVPEVIATFEARDAFVMRSAPPGTVTWKEQLMRGEVSPAVAADVGRLLGRIHGASRVRAELADEFADTSFFDELRLDPYLRSVSGKRPELAGALDDVAGELLGDGMCLVHGDFSPKNLLVMPDGGVLLVDHEVAHWGHPAFDVAFVMSHLCLKAVRFRADGGARRYLAAAATALDAYAGAARPLRAGLGRFAARTIGALLLARVDGKSPVEYLTDERDRELVRDLGRQALLDAPADPWAVLDRVRAAVADG